MPPTGSRAGRSGAGGRRSGSWRSSGTTTAWTGGRLRLGPAAARLCAGSSPGRRVLPRRDLQRPARQDSTDLFRQREMENAYLEGARTGRMNSIFRRDADAAWDLFTLGAYRDLKHYAESADMPEAAQEERCEGRRLRGLKAIGPYSADADPPCTTTLWPWRSARGCLRYRSASERRGPVANVVTSAMSTIIAKICRRQDSELVADVQRDQLHQPAGVHEGAEREGVAPARCPSARGREHAAARASRPWPRAMIRPQIEPAPRVAQQADLACAGR